MLIEKLSLRVIILSIQRIERIEKIEKGIKRI
jgi:hypothetical protein